MIYWDHNATAPVRARVRTRMMEALELYPANPNSMHSPGQKARAIIESVRRKGADTLEADPSELIFTGSATEANFLALWGLWFARTKENSRRHKILTTSVEHSSVHENLCNLAEKFGATVEYLTPDRAGGFDLAALERKIADEKESLAFGCFIAAHNETGVVYPWTELAQIFGRAEIPFHTDLVQMFGRLPFSLRSSLVSTASLGFHKIGGPKGVGLLYVRKGTLLDPVLRGGSQEKKRRAGTENLEAIVGFGAVLEEKEDLESSMSQKIRPLRDAFEMTVLAQNPNELEIVCAKASRLPNTSYLVFRRAKSDAMLMHLDTRGICASSGAACASGMVLPSRTLLGLGFSEQEALSGIRFSLGPESCKSELEEVVAVVHSAIGNARPQ